MLSILSCAFKVPRFWCLNLVCLFGMSKSAFFHKRFPQNGMDTIQHRMPAHSLCRTIIETLTDPRTVQLSFLNMCQEHSRKMKGRERIMTCKMRKRKKSGPRKDKGRTKKGNRKEPKNNMHKEHKNVRTRKDDDKKQQGSERNTGWETNGTWRKMKGQERNLNREGKLM